MSCQVDELLGELLNWRATHLSICEEPSYIDAEVAGGTPRRTRGSQLR